MLSAFYVSDKSPQVCNYIFDHTCIYMRACVRCLNLRGDALKCVHLSNIPYLLVKHAFVQYRDLPRISRGNGYLL